MVLCCCNRNACIIINYINGVNGTDDINNINFKLELNQKTVQNSNTRLMLWKVDELISYISKYFTLKIGDIIFTGTPSGVGKVDIGDELQGYLENQKLFNLKIK